MNEAVLPSASHLSVSLRHDGSESSADAKRRSAKAEVMPLGTLRIRKPSDKSKNTVESAKESTSLDAQDWFDHSNERAETGLEFDDGECGLMLEHPQSNH